VSRALARIPKAECAASIISVCRDNHFCRLSPS
jgi:hypothetical protein